MGGCAAAGRWEGWAPRAGVAGGQSGARRRRAAAAPTLLQAARAHRARGAARTAVRQLKGWASGLRAGGGRGACVGENGGQRGGGALLSGCDAVRGLGRGASPMGSRLGSTGFRGAGGGLVGGHRSPAAALRRCTSPRGTAAQHAPLHRKSDVRAVTHRTSVVRDASRTAATSCRTTCSRAHSIRIAPAAAAPPRARLRRAQAQRRCASGVRPLAGGQNAERAGRSVFNYPA